MIKLKPLVRLHIIKIFSQLSSSRQSIITGENQRNLFKRLNILSLVVFAETSDLNSKEFQLELLYLVKKMFYLYGEGIYKNNRSYVEVIWRAIMRIVLYVLSQNSVYFDEETVHKVWDFLINIKKRKLHKYLYISSTQEIEKQTTIDENTNSNLLLYSGKLFTIFNIDNS